MPRRRDQLLHVNHPLAKGGLRFGLRRGELMRELARLVHAADAPPATARHCFKQKWVTDPLRRRAGRRHIGQRWAARRNRHAGLDGQGAAGRFIAQTSHGLGRWPDKDQPRACHLLNERGRLGQEAIARVDGLRADGESRLDQRRTLEIAVDGWRRTDTDHAVGQASR